MAANEPLMTSSH